MNYLIEWGTPFWAAIGALAAEILRQYRILSTPAAAVWKPVYLLYSIAIVVVSAVTVAIITAPNIATALYGGLASPTLLTALWRIGLPDTSSPFRSGPAPATHQRSSLSVFLDAF